MPIFDMHAHLTPECFRRGVQPGGSWNGMTSSVGELGNPRDSWIVVQRMQEMDSLGIDVQVVSTVYAFYRYEDDLSTAIAIAQDCNNEVAQMTRDNSTSVHGSMQPADAGRLGVDRRVGARMTELGLKGAMINDHVNGKTYDEPDLFPPGRRQSVLAL